MILKLMYVILLAVPVCAVILGFLCWRCPPKGPTWAYGYRSRRARASTQSWLFAQHLAGQIWYFLGLILLISTVFVLKKLNLEHLEQSFSTAAVWVVVQLVLICLCQLPTEYLLLRRFDRFGRTHMEKDRQESQFQQMEYEETARYELPDEPEEEFRFDRLDDFAPEAEENMDIDF